MYLLKRIALIVAAVTVSLAPAGAADTVEPVKVFIFAGQSNMVGSDAHAEKIDGYPMFKGAGAPQADVLYSYILGDGDEASNGWVPLRPLSAFGPELTFARVLKRSDPAPIAIIKSAVGGTTVAYDWNPDAPAEGKQLYPRTLNLIRESLRQLRERGVTYRLEGVMWHQGENDMLDRKLNTNYATGLTRLIKRLRQDLEAPDLKWFVGEVSEKGIWGMDNRKNLAILREQQDRVLAADPLLYWVPTSHLAFEVMDSGQPHYHFGTQGQLQLGESFAASYLRAIGKLPQKTSQGFEDGLPVASGARVRLFVLAGQRNMEGENSFVSEIAQNRGFEELAKSQKQILFRYSLGGGVKTSSDWEPLGPVDDLGNFGPELSFGARLRKSIPPDEGIAVIRYTHSGAQSPDWFPSGSPEARRNLYPKFIGFVRSAIEDLSSKGYEVELEGVFWATGENDTWFDPYARNQAKWLKQLIDQVRLDLAQPGLRWFVCEQHPVAPWKNVASVNADLRALAASDSRVSLISTAQLPYQRFLFGTRGTLLLGQLMADAFLQNE